MTSQIKTSSSPSSTGIAPLNTNVPIAEWNQKQVCLFREGNQLAYSIEGRTGNKMLFTPSPFEIGFAVNLVLMFRNTIEANLRNHPSINHSCFIPLICVNDGITRTAQIVLFGRWVPAKENNPGMLQGLRWGVFYQVSGNNETLNEVDDCVQECVRWAPVESERTSQVMAEYMKRFHIAVTSNDQGKITKVSMTYQRTWYTVGNQSCVRALINYLLNSQEGSLQLLKQLGLAPEQIARYCTDSEWAYFRQLMQQLDQEGKENQKVIFGNLKQQFPTIFPTLLRELKESRLKLGGSQEGYATILANLNKSVFGQTYAVERLATALQSQIEGDKNFVYLFVGPSGVGKTELAKAAALLKQNRFVRFDMDQFKGETDANKMFGSAFGYVGSTDLPLFARAFEKFASPLKKEVDLTYTCSVENVIVLFDEFEKAHSQVKQSFLTLFDEGYQQVLYTQDKANFVVNYKFKKCVFIGTSNLYKQEIVEDFRSRMEPKNISEHFKQLNTQRPIAQSYSPELLARMYPVPFGPIPRGEIYQNLIRSKLPTFLNALKTDVACAEITIAESDLPQVVRQLESRLYGDGTGLRNIKDYFDNEIKTVIFQQRNWGNLKHKQITIVALEGNRLGIRCQVEAYGELLEDYPVVPI